MTLSCSAARVFSNAARGFGLLLLLIVLGTSGCTTYARRVTGIRTAFYGQHLESADQLIMAGLKRRDGNEDVLKLEHAMVQLARGEPAAAERTLREVRDHFDELEQADLAETAFSYLTDDKQRAYAGEDYEKVLVRAFLALNNLLHDGTDALAYSRQMIDKQEQIIAAGADEQGENPKADYPRVALAPYVYGMLQEATHREYDDAERSYAAVVSWQPDFDAGQQDWNRAQYGRHSQPGNGVLYVFALTGRGPYKEEVVETPSSAALLIAGEILNQAGDRGVTPNIAPVKVPRVVAQANSVQSLAVRVDEKLVGQTTTITDVTNLAIRQYETVFPTIVAARCARRCVKKGVLYGAQEAADIRVNSASSLAFAALGVAWEATESADTRCWGLLPDKIQVLRMELPAGDHQVDLAPVVPGWGGSPVVVTRSVSIADGRNTYLLAICPGESFVGEILVHQP